MSAPFEKLVNAGEGLDFLSGLKRFFWMTTLVDRPIRCLEIGDGQARQDFLDCLCYFPINILENKKWLATTIFDPNDDM